jgi:glycosyltransferase involved in cell wall biosynthesis
MRAADVLIFPSLFEGFGMVLTEALSQGLPSITTLHSAGPDILSEGIDGFIVPIRSSTAIQEKLELLLSDPQRLPAMKRAALEKARNMTWQLYRQRLQETLGCA